MSNLEKCLYAKQNGMLQIPYDEYVALADKVAEGLNLRRIGAETAHRLEAFLQGSPATAEAAGSPQAPPPARAAAPEVQGDGTDPAEPGPPVAPEPANHPSAKTPKVSKARAVNQGADIPPIKKEITAHFNRLDDSGRLLNVFQQYYACLNDACGGTVRVTMKDGICSLWNYDEWEEFCFVDLHEGRLRFALDPRYADGLEPFESVEAPRLLSSRRNVVCALADDLNKTMLDVLAKAFEEAGLVASQEGSQP